MDNSSTEIFEKLKKDFLEYLELKLELFKLNTYERTGKVIAVLSYSLILLSLGFFVVLFLCLALGFFIGELLNSTGLGFAIVALLYLIMMGIIYKNKTYIGNTVINIVISALYASDKEDKEEKQNVTKNESRESHTDTEIKST